MRCGACKAEITNDQVDAFIADTLDGSNCEVIEVRITCGVCSNAEFAFVSASKFINE